MHHQQRCRKNPANAELVREHAGCTLVPSCRVRGIGTYFAAEVNAHLCKDDVPPADVCHRCRALVAGVHRAARRMKPPQAFDNLWLAYARTTRVPPPPRWRAALLSE